MFQKELGKKLKHGFEEATPDIFENIQNCEVKKINSEEELFGINSENDFNGTERKKKMITVRIAATLAACFCLFVLGYWYEVKAVTANIMIDVNPSIELSVNRMGKVISIDAINEDAKEIVNDMEEKKGATPDEVVSELMSKLDENAYFENSENVILLTVESKDNYDYSVMEQNLVSLIKTYAEQQKIKMVVMHQSIRLEEEVLATAESMGVSKGKAALLQKLQKMTENETKTTEDTDLQNIWKEVKKNPDMLGSDINVDEETLATITNNQKEKEKATIVPVATTDSENTPKPASIPTKNPAKQSQNNHVKENDDFIYQTPLPTQKQDRTIGKKDKQKEKKEEQRASSKATVAPEQKETIAPSSVPTEKPEYTSIPYSPKETLKPDNDKRINNPEDNENNHKEKEKHRENRN